LRDRRTHDGVELSGHLPDPIVEAVGEFDPEHRSMLAEAVGLALFVVLDTLPPAERLAFVLHDVFTVPFDQIAAIVDRTPEAARKLASRARRRIEQADPAPDGTLVAQREVVDAFFAAGRSGDFGRLVAVLHPDVVLRGDFGAATAVFRAEGASAVAELARGYAGPEREVRRATVNGAAGAVIFMAGRAASVMGFVVRDGRIRAIDVLADPARIARLNLPALRADH
jgi:ketosteroid isomerase-like protein